MTPDWLAGFADGLARDQEQFGISLLGGDTGATDGPLAIAVTAFGFVPQGRMVRRSGARAGDACLCHRHHRRQRRRPGDLQAREARLDDADRDYLIARYRVPQPPVDLAAALARHRPCRVDVSDGLIADLGHIAAASGVRIVVEGERVPLSAPLHALWGDSDAACARSPRATITRSPSPRRRGLRRSVHRKSAGRGRQGVGSDAERQGSCRSKTGLPALLTIR